MKTLDSKNQELNPEDIVSYVDDYLCNARALVASVHGDVVYLQGVEEPFNPKSLTRLNIKKFSLLEKII